MRTVVVVFISFLIILAVDALVTAQNAMPAPDPVIKEFTRDSLVAIPAAGYAGGILEGFAYYLSVPLWAMRAAFIVSLFVPGVNVASFVGYIALWVLMPAIDFVPADFDTVVWAVTAVPS